MKTPERITLLFRHAAPVITAVFLVVPIATCPSAQAAAAAQELMQRGAYLARAADCIACHTAPEGEPFAGGLPLNTPIGRIYTTNITPDTETGIGRYSEADFVRIMRQGVAKDGHHLYPAMPYTSYTKLSQEDLSALYAWSMQGIEPVHHPNRPTKLSWPLSIRSLMAVWNRLYLEKGEYTAAPGKSASWNRGAYLVQGLGHCGECHTPRGVAGQVKAVSDQDGGHYLAGATLDNWYASPLTGDAETGLHAWSQDEIAKFLKTGRTERVAAFGIMAEVVAKSTQFLTDQDLVAVAEYLKSLPPATHKGQNRITSDLQADDASAATRALRAGHTEMRGARLYLDNCSACHRSDGSGAKRTFPNLAKNEPVNANDPISLSHLVLTGSAMPSTQTAPSAVAMPDFEWRLSDEDVADLLSFVRSNWGNHAAAVSSEQVGRVRQALAIQKASP